MAASPVPGEPGKWGWGRCSEFIAGNPVWDIRRNGEVGGPACWQGGWRFMILEVPSNPGHSVKRRNAL